MIHKQSTHRKAHYSDIPTTEHSSGGKQREKDRKRRRRITETMAELGQNGFGELNVTQVKL